MNTTLDTSKNSFFIYDRDTWEFYAFSDACHRRVINIYTRFLLGARSTMRRRRRQQIKLDNPTNWIINFRITLSYPAAVATDTGHAGQIAFFQALKSKQGPPRRGEENKL